MMKDFRPRENSSTAKADVDRRSFLVSAGKVSFGLAATTGLVGGFRGGALAKDCCYDNGFRPSI